MKDTEERRLVEKAVTQDLFGDGALTEAAEVIAPEKYEVIRCLGRGGFGVVYLARDDVLGRQVALKFLPNARPADVERLRREARFTARIDNPSIVQVYEFGDVDGQPYIAMQYIDGGNLGATELDRRALVEAMASLALALQHAHAEGIVHRDIKPENILLDAAGRAYLTDFGIARDLTGSSGATLSQDGLIVGTPALMSPEQARGEAHSIDARSDIYSLGATLYTKLTGRMPFSGNAVDVLHAVIHDPPSFPRSVDPSIPRALEAIVLKCMQKRKSQRYGTMGDLRAELERFLEGDDMPSESAAWFRKLVGAPVAATTPDTTEEDPLALAMEAAREISAWDANLYRVSVNLPRTYSQLDAIVARLDDVLSGNPDVAWARFYRGAAAFRRGELSAALDDMERSIDRMNAQPGAYFDLGRLYLALYLREMKSAQSHISAEGVRHQIEAARGRLEQAVIAFQEAERLKEGLPLWQVEYAKAIEKFAMEEYDECVAICDRILDDDPDVEELWKLRGDAMRLQGADPIGSYDRAVEVRRSYHDALMCKAEVLFERGDGAGAVETCERVLRIFPDYVEAVALSTRARLRDAHETKDESDVSDALDAIRRALETDPKNYELTVTRAELELEAAQLAGHLGGFDAAFFTLEKAATLPGCQNRVQLQVARTYLARARTALGATPPNVASAREDLETILGFREPDSAQARTAAWPEMFRTVEEELAKLR